MFGRKVEKSAPRVVWRMTSAHPAGAYFTTSGHEPPPMATTRSHDPGYRASSFELTEGVEVHETELSTLPADLVDELVKTRGD